MRLYVMVYDRPSEHVLEVREFSEEEFTAAEAFRLHAQRQAYREGLDRDIVLFRAVSRAAMEKMNPSYFRSTEQLEADFRQHIRRAVGA